MIRFESVHQARPSAITRLASLLVSALIASSISAQASILWSQFGTTLVHNNGVGEDILHGAIPPQGTNSNRTLYFKLRVDPISDAVMKVGSNYMAGFVLFEKGSPRLGFGNGWENWAYGAMNVTGTRNGLIDLNSATPDMKAAEKYEFIRGGVSRTIVFKVEFSPGHDARITAWLNPNLAPGAAEFNQPESLVTRFEARATFDEIHLIHQGAGGGWQFGDMAIATSFVDFVPSSFWESKWLMGLTMGGLLLAVAVIVRLVERRQAQRKIRQLEQERAVAAERTRIARDIHDELGASLTKIHKLAEMMEQQNDTAENTRPFSRMISNTARDTIQTMDEIVWAVNPENDTLKEMADYLVFFTEDFLHPSGISCCLKVPLNLPGIPVTAEVRHNLFMVVKETLNNAVKHAGAQQVRFALDYDADRLAIEINDNGRGFRLDEITETGNGLENMRRRMSAIGGDFNIQSDSAHGTTVKLQVLLKTAKPVFQ